METEERSCNTCIHRKMYFCWYGAYQADVVDEITGVVKKGVWLPTPTCRTARTSVEHSAGAYCGPEAHNWERYPTWGELFRMTFGWIPKLFKRKDKEEV